MGALVDDLLLDKSAFKTKYFVFDGKKPTATLGKLADLLLENYNKIPSKKQILNIIEANNFWKRAKEETLIGYIENKEFINYIKAQYKSKTKILLTTEELAKGNELADILLTHKHSKHILINDLENHNQYKFTLTYNNMKFRGIIDKLLIDHDNKTVQIIDLKTGQGDISEFTTSYLKWRYYLQEAIYQKAFNHIKKKFKLKGYKLLPFKFLYISRYERIPCVFIISDKWHKAALKGFTTNFGYSYKGLDTLIEEIKWHYDNKIFNMKKNIYESDGVINMYDEYIKIDK